MRDGNVMRDNEFGEQSTCYTILTTRVQSLKPQKERMTKLAHSHEHMLISLLSAMIA